MTVKHNNENTRLLPDFRVWLRNQPAFDLTESMKTIAKQKNVFTFDIDSNEIGGTKCWLSVQTVNNEIIIECTAENWYDR